MISSQRQCFIAQLDRASHRYREVTGSNSVEVLTFSGFCSQLLKLHSQLRWSWLTWIQIRSSMYETFHTSLHNSFSHTYYINRKVSRGFHKISDLSWHRIAILDQILNRKGIGLLLRDLEICSPENYEMWSLQSRVSSILTLHVSVYIHHLYIHLPFGGY